MKRVLHWGAPPAALAFSLPHVLAMLPSSIEASLQPMCPDQTCRPSTAPLHMTHCMLAPSRSSPQGTSNLPEARLI